MKTRERERARVLRQAEGRSIKDIARVLCVSQSSVSLWVRDIALTPEQHEALRMQNPAYNQLLNGRAIAAANRGRERLAAQDEGRRMAERRDSLHVAGTMLCWAEGTKSRNQVRFSNSDPELVRAFVEFLRKYFELRDNDIRVTCHLYAGHLERQREIEHFWIRTLDLPESSLCTSVVNRYSKHSKRKRANMLPYGTCRVVVSRTSIVQHIYGAIQELGGFHRDEWLDC